MSILVAVFIFLHALIHLLYLGQSVKRLELKPGMTWPDESWVFSELLSDTTVRKLANTFLLISATGFVSGAFGILIDQSWKDIVMVLSSAASTLTFVLFWNGRFESIIDHGALAVIINFVLLLYLFVT